MGKHTIYAQLLVDEARRRGIAVRSYLDASGDFALLTYQGHDEPIYMAMTNHFGQVWHRVVFNKELSMAMLREAGFPVPASQRTNDFEEAADFLRRYKKIVVKPFGRSGGKGITVGVESETTLRDALVAAQEQTIEKSRRIICQEFVEGDDARVLVVDQRLIFAARRVPAHVVGDGRQTVQELVDALNRAVIEMRKVDVTKNGEVLLHEQGLGLDSVPKDGQTVWLSRLANAQQGAIVEDLTDNIAGEVREAALAVARHFRCPFLGVDFISPDITRKVGRIIELNPHAGIAMHHFPSKGKSHNVAGAIIDMIFPETVESS